MTADHKQTLGTWNRGAGELPLLKITERGQSNLYMDMTFLPEYITFSIEEHRLEDYKQTRTGSAAEPSLQQTSNMASTKLSTSTGLASYVV